MALTLAMARPMAEMRRKALEILHGTLSTLRQLLVLPLLLSLIAALGRETPHLPCSKECGRLASSQQSRRDLSHGIDTEARNCMLGKVDVEYLARNRIRHDQ